MSRELSEALAKLSLWEATWEPGRLWVGVRWPELTSFGGKCSIRVNSASLEVEVLPLAAPLGGMLPSCAISLPLKPVVNCIYNTSDDPPFFPQVPNPDQFVDCYIFQYPLQDCYVLIARIKPNAMP